MKVFVLIRVYDFGYDGESKHIAGVFSSKELAQKEVGKESHGEFELFEWEIDGDMISEEELTGSSIQPFTGNFRELISSFHVSGMVKFPPKDSAMPS